MKTTVILLAILLAGCTTVPVKQEWPELPKELAEPCGTLKLLEGDKVVLSKLLETVATNYGMFHQCSLQHGNLVEWYKKQAEIYKKANN